MKVGDLVRYKDTIREDVGIITKIFPMGDNSVRFGSIFGRRVHVITTTGLRQFSEKNLEVLNESR